MMKELTRDEMEMVWGGAEVKAEKKKNSEYSVGDLVVWTFAPDLGTGIVTVPGDDYTQVFFPLVGILPTIPNDQLYKW